ncbi:hypothetical protein ED208_00750 [Stagnimonas aquatica]|uniref:Uncharacterized protein n=1 Tax=Stagnimonas aquatica TaxID=2689987 RepID=A0A3N0VK15_9GAMM|nr:hypothetical protein [Stagnimonas aquatica]ROH93097.1 hypothetical protein ED208_00750 [Stagnimonas aquatica]
MELAPLHWQQLPLILAVLAAASGVLYGLLSLILPRPQVWAPRDGQGLDGEAMPLRGADRRRNHQAWPAHLERRLAPR